MSYISKTFTFKQRYPSKEDYENILNLLILNDQLNTMRKEYDQLHADEKIDKESTIFQLNPFICKEDAVIKNEAQIVEFRVTS